MRKVFYLVKSVNKKMDEAEYNFLSLKNSTTHQGRFYIEQKNAVKKTSNEQVQTICQLALSPELLHLWKRLTIYHNYFYCSYSNLQMG